MQSNAVCLNCWISLHRFLTVAFSSSVALVALFCFGVLAPVTATVDVFLIPHSHCDAGTALHQKCLITLISAGWLKTFEEYYSVQVLKILSTVTAKLSTDRSLKFNVAEIGFFERWWRDQSPAVQSQFRTLVDNGQIEFICAGWVQVCGVVFSARVCLLSLTTRTNTARRSDCYV